MFQYLSNNLNSQSVPSERAIGTNQQYLSNSLGYVYQPEIGERKEITSNTQTAKMTVANVGLTGSGTTYEVITTSSGNGSIVKGITIKAEVSTSRGKVRFFLRASSGARMIMNEIVIPERAQAGKQETFAFSFCPDFHLEDDFTIYATTQNAEATIITVESEDISFP